MKSAIQTNNTATPSNGHAGLIREMMARIPAVATRAKYTFMARIYSILEDVPRGTGSVVMSRPAWCLAHKSPRSGRKVKMYNNGFELFVEVNGRSIPEFGHKGRTFVEGRKSHPYKIRFRNSRAERVLVVPTVDNLSVVDGHPYSESSPGYVVQGYSSLTISGWRTSLNEVRAFKFDEKAASFAGKTAGQQNCGVIGAKIYAELCPKTQDIHIHHYSYGGPVITQWTSVTPHDSGNVYIGGTSADFMDQQPKRMCSTGVSGMNSMSQPVGVFMMAAAAQASNSAPDFNLGTGYGASINDIVTTTNFDRGICLATFEIYYSDRDGLLKDGIPVDKTPELARFPQAFGGFCQLP